MGNGGLTIAQMMNAKTQDRGKALAMPGNLPG